MLRDLSPPQRELAEFMSSLSERAYAAGWMNRLEFMLWETIHQREPLLGSMPLAKEEVLQLRALSQRCGGWIYFDEKTEETFIPANRWLALVSSAPSGATGA